MNKKGIFGKRQTKGLSSIWGKSGNKFPELG